MKKNYFRNLLFIILSLVFVVLSCKVDSSVTNSELPMDKLDIDDFTTSFGKALCLTVEATRDMASYLVDEGVVSIPTAQVKSSAIKNTDFCDILNNYYNSRKSINADLDGKMDEIVDRYNSSINQIIPSTNNIVEQNMLSVENGNLIISDCENIPINSLEGIASIEIMDMIANGKSAKEAVEIIEKDINKIFNAQDIMHTKGLYVGVQNTDGNGMRWKNGVIKYHFVDGDLPLSDECKTEFKSAMKDWTSKTNNKITFEEVSPSAWNKFCAGLFQYEYVKIMNAKLSPGVLGQSTVGSISHGISSLSIDETKLKNYTWAQTHRTIRHELGHTIGLQHEHQRADRDEFIIVEAKGSNYDVIPDKKFYFAVYPLRVWFFIIYLPYVWYGDYAQKVGTFDFDSIMLYGGYSVRPNKVALNKGYIYTFTNYEISDTDVKAVLQMYK